MTISRRSILFVAFFATAVVAVFLATPPSTEIVRVSTERRDAATRSMKPAIARAPPQAPANVPAADARTQLKYRHLLEDVAGSSAASNDLLASLQAREEAARVGAELGELDAAVLSILSPRHHAMYIALRDSDAEQRALGDFAGGLAHDAPLSGAQRRELLFAKLRHKQHYELLLEQSGIDRTGVSDEERSYAHSLLAQALRTYRDTYLQEMQGHLDAEQFRLLTDFERTEFELELQRLQRSINER